MKKSSYIIFGFVLVLLILAFSYTSSYLSSLEESAKAVKNRPVDRAALDSLETELQTRFNEYRAFVDKRIDTLERQYHESDNRPTEATVDLAAKKSGASAPKVGENAKAARVESKAAGNSSTAKTKPLEKKSSTPSEEELAVYQEFLKRRLTLPADLSAYELKVAKAEILSDIGRAHNLKVDQVVETVDRVYEYRRKGSKN